VIVITSVAQHDLQNEAQNAQVLHYDILIFQSDRPYGFWTPFHYLCSSEMTSIYLDEKLNSNYFIMLVLNFNNMVIS